jgi:hypothetical protein
MIHLTMTPLTSDIRAYLDKPNGYADREPYRAKLTVLHLSDTLVYLQGAMGVVDRATWHAFFDLMRSRGVTKVQLERHGRMKFIDL